MARRRRSAPTYLTERDGRIWYHYRLVVEHRGVRVVRWVNCLSEYPYDWRASLEAVRMDRERRRREIVAEIERDLAGGDLATFCGWVARYLRLIAARKRRTDADRRYLERAVELWGDRPLASLTRADVEAGMESEAARARETLRSRRRKRGETGPLPPEAGHASANRWLAAVSACLEEARRQGLISVNPAREVRPYREAPPRARVLSAEEQERLAGAIFEEPDPAVRLAFVLLVETGARKSEVLGARWNDFDLEAGTWRIPAPKSGRPQVVPLPGHVVEMLRAAPRTSEWVVPGAGGRRRHDLRGPWRRLKARAGLPADLTIHDLRRTFGLRVARAAGLHVASRLLRHSTVRITERVYAPLGLEELRAAAEAAATLSHDRPTPRPKPPSEPAPHPDTPEHAPSRK